MDRVDNLVETVRREVAEYACPSPNATAYYVENADQQTFAVLSAPTKEPQRASVVILARVVDDQVLIVSDKTNKPLYEALLQAGVPRERMILVYEGEKMHAA